MFEQDARLDALHDRIEDSDVLTPEDKHLLFRFSDETGVDNYSAARRVKLLQHCTLLAGDSRKYDPEDLPEPSIADIVGESDEAKQKAKRYVSWINRNYDSEESKRDHRVALRMLGGHVRRRLRGGETVER